MDEDEDEDGPRNLNKPNGDKKTKEKMKREREASTLQDKIDSMLQSNKVLLGKSLDAKIEMAEKKAREKQERLKLLKEVEERKTHAAENKTMVNLLAEENRIMTLNRNDMDDISKEWHDMIRREILKRRMLACYGGDGLSSEIGTGDFGAGVGITVGLLSVDGNVHHDNYPDSFHWCAFLCNGEEDKDEMVLRNMLERSWVDTDDGSGSGAMTPVTHSRIDGAGAGPSCHAWISEGSSIDGAHPSASFTSGRCSAWATVGSSARSTHVADAHSEIEGMCRRPREAEGKGDWALSKVVTQSSSRCRVMPTVSDEDERLLKWMYHHSLTWERRTPGGSGSAQSSPSGRRTEAARMTFRDILGI
ncbi:TGACG-sequence-specific DNA-binding protein TGA-2.1 [Hordeum vulgare]|nr:TGACG-sequence-specific DNA-binding protein TGA-2.1 [Hordeum vulgare]